jgi:hypothetical protein
MSDMETQFLVHEKECAERWKTTFSRLDEIDSKLEKAMTRQLQGGAAVITFLAMLVATLALGL